VLSMSRSCMHEQISEQVIPVAVLGEHFLYGKMDDFLGFFLEHQLVRLLVQCARVACVVTINFLKSLATCHFGVGSINSDTYVTLVVTSRIIAWLVSASDEFSD